MVYEIDFIDYEREEYDTEGDLEENCAVRSWVPGTMVNVMDDSESHYPVPIWDRECLNRGD